MIIRALRRTTVLILVATTLLLGGTASAQASSEVVRDGHDTSMDADIARVRVNHGRALVVRTRLDRLRGTKRRVLQGMNVYVDLRPRHAGPELMVEAGLWGHADHVVTRARGWRRGSEIQCRSRLGTDPERDLVILRLRAGCLPARHPRARVAVVTSERSAHGAARWDSDWMTGRRTFSPWVARG